MTDTPNCNCGFGGFHEPLNRRCDAFDPNHEDVATPDPDGTRVDVEAIKARWAKPRREDFPDGAFGDLSCAVAQIDWVNRTNRDARTDVPLLLTEVELLTAERDGAEGAMEAAITRAESAEAALARVEALADEWIAADGEPVSSEGLAVLSTVNRKGRELRAALAHATPTPQPRPDATESPESAERGEKAPGCQSGGSGALAGAEGVGDE